jgi:glycosyltransferase involved in cell wall biosynthesis
VIYLRPEIRSALGEDTFWNWFHREFPGSTFAHADGGYAPGDVVIQYSTLGACPPGVTSIGLLWELYPEMRHRLGSSEWDAKCALVEQCAETATIPVVATPYMRQFYTRDTAVVPVGVDTDLFHPSESLPAEDTYFWCGTDHRMKGRDLLEEFRKHHPGEYTVVIKGELPQEELAGRMRECRYFVSTGRLAPLFLVEWEALASGCVLVDASDIRREYDGGNDPRRDVFEIGWDRHAVKKKWEELLRCAK